MCLCNVNMHIPAAEQGNEKRRHVRTKKNVSVQGELAHLL
jgi:hypothetical protein